MGVCTVCQSLEYTYLTTPPPTHPHTQMCSMSVEQLESGGMTQGAAKKLFRKVEELK